MGEAAEAPAQDFELYRKPGYDNTFVLSGMYYDLSPGDRRVLLDDWYKKLQATLAEKNKGMTGIFKDMVRKLLEGLPGSSADPEAGVLCFKACGQDEWNARNYDHADPRYVPYCNNPACVQGAEDQELRRLYAAAYAAGDQCQLSDGGVTI